jgi:transcriptional repressor NrdR
LILAFAKRQISSDKIDTIISQLEGDRSKKKDEISSSEIGDDILALLKTIDPVAYVRFASVYKNFDTLDDFHALLQ